jgi:uncharacterized protein YdaU (DUF1376 family)
LAIQWRDGYIPSDPAKIARFCACSPSEFAPIWEELKEKFDPVDGGLANPRLERDRTNMDELRLKRAEASRKGHAVRWGSHNKPMPNACQPHDKPVPTALQNDAEKEKEKEKEKEIPPLSPKGEKKRSPKVSAKDRALGVYQFLGDHLLSEDVYKSLLLYFQNGKATLKTEVAYKMLAKKLNEFQEDEVIAACESGIAANHQSLYPKKSDGKRAPRPTKANTPVEVDVEELEWMTS